MESAACFASWDSVGLAATDYNRFGVVFRRKVRPEIEMQAGSRGGRIRLVPAVATALAIGACLAVLAMKQREGAHGKVATETKVASPKNVPDQGQSARYAAEGERLIQSNRLVLGRALLEAARRLDPRNAGARRALDDLQTRAAAASGAERTAMNEAAGRAESLLGVKGGEPLAALALGLAAIATNPEQELEILDRLEYLNHARLRAVKSTHDAVKLVARILLECGRTGEAKDLLAPLVETTAEVDHEAFWLLSRVYLARDEPDLADSALKSANGWGDDGLAGPEPTPFVGSRECARCHRALTRDQQRESRHATTLGLGQSLASARLPAQRVPDPIIPGLSHLITREPNGQLQVESRLGDLVVRAVVEYAVGSGHHGVTMVARDQMGVERQLRVSYLTSIDGWGETKGISKTTRDDGELLGLALAPETTSRCLHCHATWFRSVDLRRNGPRGPEALDHGIGCERCHGPGLNHVKAAQTGFAQPAIALGAHAPASLRLASCYECHAADPTLQPSDPEFTRAQGTTLQYSRCYTAAKDRFDCVTCHDPHQILDENAANYEAKCLNCHAAKTPCPVNPRSGCVACHMPKVDDPSRKTRYTDHHIRVHRDRPPG